MLGGLWGIFHLADNEAEDAEDARKEVEDGLVVEWGEGAAGNDGRGDGTGELAGDKHDQHVLAL